MANPNCPFKVVDCFANSSGTRCSILENTDFVNRTVCPFYKSKVQYATERKTYPYRFDYPKNHKTTP